MNPNHMVYGLFLGFNGFVKGLRFGFRACVAAGHSNGTPAVNPNLKLFCF